MSALGFVAGAAPVAAKPSDHGAFAAVVVRVTDGDTLWVRSADVGSRPVKVRLQGIDAPEACQAWGPQSTAALRARAMHQPVTVQSQAVDAYRRTIARVWLAGEDLGAAQVREGHAWSQHFHRSLGPYAAQEQSARNAGRGLFAAANPQNPREFRRQHGPCR
jgi:micrococcal nuclease